MCVAGACPLERPRVPLGRQLPWEAGSPPGEAAVTAAVPARIEDVAASLHEQIVQLAERQHVDLAQLAIDQKERLARIERHARRGRWRR